MIKCDCCGRDLKDGENSYKISLPYRYRCKSLPTVHGYITAEGLPITTYKTKMKSYDFCEDCYNGFGEMMYMFNENPKYFNTLFPNIAFIANMLSKRRN